MNDGRRPRERLLLPGTEPPWQSGSTAMFSTCTRYRYLLTRRWAPGGTSVLFLMLNPSTADATLDDPTIRRCLCFARSWGHSSLVVANIFAWRSTDPRALGGSSDPIGPENDSVILAAAREASVTICAWGKRGALHGRAAEVITTLRAHGIDLRALKLNGDGSPVHPLYQPASAVLVPF